MQRRSQDERVAQALEEERSVFLARLRPITLCLFTALALLLFLKAPLANAQQVTPVPPFVGTHSETWERFGVGAAIPSGTSILGGIATISGDHMVTYHDLEMCCVTGTPSDGTVFMFSDRPSGPLTISFSEPVSAFGAYWGSGFCPSPVLCFGDPPSILTFRDVTGNVIGTDSFVYMGDGTLAWHGYQFATPVKTITRTAGDGVEGVGMDGLQATVAAPLPTTLGNISTRSFVQTGENVMIGGFIVQGTGAKRVIIRAIGPELTQYGINDALANPRLELHNGTGALIASNDNWQTTILGGIITTNQVSDIQNSGRAPTAASESAIIADLSPGNYTAIVRGVSNTTGIALVEVYDLNLGTTSSLGNISTRSYVQTGEHVMIGGFIVQGTGPKRVIIRAIGPELTQYGITNPLANPRLELHNRTGALIGSNDNWQTTILGGVITTNQVSAIQNSGHAPTAASESAIIADLAPGNYTAIVRGVNNTAGVALVEVYDLD
jgi:hypothetical protein